MNSYTLIAFVVLYFSKKESCFCVEQLEGVLDCFVHIEILVVRQTSHEHDSFLVGGHGLVPFVKRLIFGSGNGVVRLSDVRRTLVKENGVGAAAGGGQVLVLDDAGVVDGGVGVVDDGLGLKEIHVADDPALEGETASVLGGGASTTTSFHLLLTYGTRASASRGERSTRQWVP